MIKIKGRALVMGILNVTPDSFSDGGEFIDEDKAVEHGKRVIEEGADIIDIGGESSRPGSEPVTEEEELRRVRNAVLRLVKETNVPISIDTYKARVAEECVKAGASIINDITGIDDEMRAVAARYNVSVIIMHMKGRPKTMQDNISYKDMVGEIKGFLKERAMKAKAAGINDIVIDPGIGFGKTTEQNLEILRRLDEFKEIGYPVLIGASRKSFIGKVLGVEEPGKRATGTIAANIMAAEKGAGILRVHDVRENVMALEMIKRIMEGGR
ncbi:dihydropteroate synthase [Candidatus Woesearchaeota archaeon]|nr:dihydropteroate synthase [Candidatus Woesearchaeota archaeon]